MKRLALITAAALLLMVAQLAVSQRNFDNVQFKVSHVAGSVHVLDSGAGGNIGISMGEDGALMIDDQFAPLAPKIRAAMKGIGNGKLRFLVNTHHHGDHTGGNPEFGGEATIVAHSNVRKRLMDTNQPKVALPVVTFRDSVTLHFNGEDVEIQHMPTGHTDSDSVIFFKKSNVIHMGDHFFAGRFPYVDLKGGGNVEGFLKNVATVIEQAPSDVKIIPGHGPLSTLDDLKTFHAGVRESADYIRSQMKAGKSLADIKQAGLPAKWDTWASGFINEERWIEIVYNSYSG